MDAPIEVKTATLETFDGEQKQVEGGVWLSPSSYLELHARMERTKQVEAAQASNQGLVMVGIGAALLGAAMGYWLARDDD